MLKIKIEKGTSYKVMSPDTSNSLKIGFAVTLKEAITRTLAAEKRAKDKGYDGERWLVVETKWSRVYNKNGEFLRENVHSEVVAIVNADGTVEYKE